MTNKRQVTYSEHPTRQARNIHARGEKEFSTYDTSFIHPKRNNQVPTVVGLVLAVIAVLILYSMLGRFVSCSHVELLEEGAEVTVVVPDGATTTEIAQSLVDAGLIPDTTSFTSLVTPQDADGSLKPGTYTMVGGSSSETLIEQLIQGPPLDTFTVPEGLTIDQTADVVSEAYGDAISADDFKAAARNAEAYATDFPFVADAYENSLEGFLFPKTYEKEEGDTAESVVRKMLSQYQQETQNFDFSYPNGRGLSNYQALIMASVIEREASEGNRATVASVIYNRLNAGMQLQVDATVAYLVGHEPTPEDLQIDSPYNTYLNYGLPPGPICSPSTASLEAVCHPEETNYLYFYFEPDENGEMKVTFTETYEEHQDVIGGWQG